MHVEFPSPPPTPRPLPAPVADEPPRLTARTLEGLEWLLARELEAVGATDLRVGRRTIEFAASPSAEKETLYRAVLECRTAIRVLEPLGRFRVASPEALYGAMPLGLSAGQVLSLPMIVIGLWLLVMLQRTPARRS